MLCASSANKQKDVQDKEFGYVPRLCSAAEKRLASPSFSEPDANKWSILTNELLDVYRMCFRNISLSFEDFPYFTLMTKLQDLARDEVGDPKVPLQNQRKEPSTSAAL